MLQFKWVKTEPDPVRCQTASIVGRAIPLALAALLVHSSGRKELGVRGREGEVRRAKGRRKHGRGRSENKW